MPLEDYLLTESRNPRSESIDTLSPLEIVRLINTEDIKVVEAVRAEAESIAQAIDWAADRLRRGGRLIYVGAGTSGAWVSLMRPSAPDLQNPSRNGGWIDRRRSDRANPGH